jgi:hypothetical protein
VVLKFSSQVWHCLGGHEMQEITSEDPWATSISWQQIYKTSTAH